jgi:hypothetical protein
MLVELALPEGLVAHLDVLVQQLHLLRQGFSLMGFMPLFDMLFIIYYGLIYLSVL